MTSAEFKTALTRLGYSQAGFAHLLGVHRVTVLHWARGTYKVPRYVEVIVELLGEQARPLPDDERAEMKVKLNKRELAATLAALRYWQWQRYNLAIDERMQEIFDIESDGDTLDVLSAEEIDELCERINTRG